MLRELQKDGESVNDVIGRLMDSTDKPKSLESRPDTNIRISDENHARLGEYKSYAHESYDKILNRLIHTYNSH